MLDYLLVHTWTLAVLWAAIYAFDYLSTLWLARAYETTISHYLLYEHGVELNPTLEKAIASRRLPGLRVFVSLALVLLMVLFSPLIGSTTGIPWLGYFFTEFIAGALLLTWSFINSRHLRNYFYVWSLRRKPDAVKGRQEYSYWFMQRNLSADALAFSLLFLFLFLLTWRIFFAAGMFTCLVLAIRAYRLANRKFPAAPPAGPAASTSQ